MKQQTYKLYHRDTLWFPFGRAIEDPIDPGALGWPARYRHVADLQTASLDSMSCAISWGNAELALGQVSRFCRS